MTQIQNRYLRRASAPAPVVVVQGSMRRLGRASHSQPATPAATVTPARRMRRVAEASSEVDVEGIKLQIYQKLDAYNVHAAVVEERAAYMSSLKGEIEALLAAGKLPGITDGKWRAEIKEKFSKQTRSVDAAELFESMPLDTFLACVSVSITALKDHMGEKEIDKISKKVGAVSQGHEMTLTRVKT